MRLLHIDSRKVFFSLRSDACVRDVSVCDLCVCVMCVCVMGVCERDGVCGMCVCVSVMRGCVCVWE